VSELGRRSRIWVRACQRPDANLPALKSIDAIGGNQGNLLYQFSAHRSLVADNVRVSTISYGRFDGGPVEERAERINSECDHLVLPLSSSFRLQMLDNLKAWADLVERLTIPVTVVGIGAQLRLQDVDEGTFVPSRVTGIAAPAAEIEEHEAASRRFVAAVLERSSTIGVRGEITRDYLRHLGFPADRIDVIGCPSLFMWGPGFRMPDSANEPRLTARSRISMSFDHRIEPTADVLAATAADFPRSTVYAQEKLGARMVVDGTETRATWKGDPRFPVHTSHQLYREHRMAYSPTAWSWIRHLEDDDFAFGPRLHGTVAATLAGTSAHLLVHDSRTLEVARHHHLPHTLTRDLGDVRSVRDLAARQDYTAFNRAYPELLDAYLAFLTRNGLPNAYAPGASGARLAALDASLVPARKARTVLSATDGAEPSVPSRIAEGLRGAIRRVTRR
jgi:hypothetical protein